MNEKQKVVSLAWIGLGLGAAFGYLIGTAIGDVGLGISLGAAFGLVFAPMANRKK